MPAKESAKEKQQHLDFKKRSFFFLCLFLSFWKDLWRKRIVWEKNTQEGTQTWFKLCILVSLPPLFGIEVLVKWAAAPNLTDSGMERFTAHGNWIGPCLCKGSCHLFFNICINRKRVPSSCCYCRHCHPVQTNKNPTDAIHEWLLLKLSWEPELYNLIYVTEKLAASTDPAPRIEVNIGPNTAEGRWLHVWLQGRDKMEIDFVSISNIGFHQFPQVAWSCCPLWFCNYTSALVASQAPFKLVVQSFK